MEYFMNKVRAAVALLSGLALYNGFVHFGGFLAAISVPKAYFELFGRQQVLALFVLDAFTFALPCFALSAVWSWITLRTLAPARSAAKWCLGGIVLGWLYWEMQFILMALPLPDRLPLSSLILGSLIPPVWAVLHTLAVPLGLALAVWLIARGEIGASAKAKLVSR
jgi:hypothetical protein